MCVQRLLRRKKKYTPSIPTFLSKICKIWSTDSQHGEDMEQGGAGRKEVIWAFGGGGGSLSRSLGTHARKKKCQNVILAQ